MLRILQSQVPNGLDAGHPFVHPLDRAAPVPVACIWEVTRAFNLSCVHCDNHARRPSSKSIQVALVTNGTLLDELASERAQASGVDSDPTRLAAQFDPDLLLDSCIVTLYLGVRAD